MSKSFQKRWRKRNGKGCTYPNCDCVGPMACAHGEKRTVPATATPTSNTAGTQSALPFTSNKWTTAQWRKPDHQCTHYGDKLLFRINDSEIYASTATRAQHDGRAKLVLQCVDTYFTEPTLARLPAGFEALRAHTHVPPPTIVLPWPDYGLPPVYRSFWAELIKLLPAGRVVVACQGSHGRTGTALAALLITHMHMTATEAVDFVRRVHCERAVESEQQADYLALLAKWDAGELTKSLV